MPHVPGRAMNIVEAAILTEAEKPGATREGVVDAARRLAHVRHDTVEDTIDALTREGLLKRPDPTGDDIGLTEKGEQLTQGPRRVEKTARRQAGRQPDEPASAPPLTRGSAAAQDRTRQPDRQER